MQAVGELEVRTFDPVDLKAHAAEFDVEVFRKKYHDTVVECAALAGKIIA